MTSYLRPNNVFHNVLKMKTQLQERQMDMHNDISLRIIRL